MKNFIVLINIAMVLIVAAMVSEKEEQSTASSVIAERSNVVPASLVAFSGSERVDHSAPINNRSNDAYVKDFIYQISEARIMGSEEGKLASQRGTSRSLKDYGTLMINDQSDMLKDLRKIASTKKMDVASTLGESKTEGLSDLNKLHGKDFDKKFIKMMAIDHRRDIKKLEKATHSKDAEIQVFATRYLPIIRQHLEKIEAIKKEM